MCAYVRTRTNYDFKIIANASPSVFNDRIYPETFGREEEQHQEQAIRVIDNRVIVN